ncbi:hypothetical protein NE865_07454 [Phthorimaea operculella]|nr:hypothetical protein NE865_07454 [Phthorimaea operculella]
MMGSVAIEDNKPKCNGCLSVISNSYLKCSICNEFYCLICCQLKEDEYLNLSSSYKNTWNCACCCGRPRDNDDKERTPKSLHRRAEVSGHSNVNNLARGGSRTAKNLYEEAKVNSESKSTKPAKPTNPSVSGDNTSLKNSPIAIDPKTNPHITVQMIRAIIREEMSTALDNSTELKIIKDKIEAVESSVSFFNTMFEALKTELVKDLGERLELVENVMRESNVEVNGLPEHRTENLAVSITQLGKVVDCPIADGNIVNVTRVAKLNSESEKPRAVIVKMKNRLLRDKLLASVANFNRKFSKEKKDEKLNSSHLGIAGSRVPIYVSEHLSPTRKFLHAAARKKARELNYRFVWVGDGRIYVRKNEQSNAIHIRNLEGIAKIV